MADTNKAHNLHLSLSRIARSIGAHGDSRLANTFAWARS
jgi:hypothetical protein